MTRLATPRGRLLLGALLLAAAAGLSAYGWHWWTHLPLGGVEVHGERHADPDALRRLARLDSVQTLYAADPVLVADRVVRHPWVAAAEARRLPTGTLAVTVTERTPAALVLDARGAPSHYLDRQGYQMPLAPGTVYDVPLLRGPGLDYHPVQPVDSEAVRRLLAALAEADEATDALVSELVLRDGEVWAYTPAPGDRGSIPVRLGRRDFDAALRRLHAFWHQAVLPQPGTTFQQVDLRFDSQIITREAVGR